MLYPNRVFKWLQSHGVRYNSCIRSYGEDGYVDSWWLDVWKFPKDTMEKFRSYLIRYPVPNECKQYVRVYNAEIGSFVPVEW